MSALLDQLADALNAVGGGQGETELFPRWVWARAVACAALWRTPPPARTPKSSW